MLKQLTPILLCLCLVGCLDAKIDPKVNTDIDSKIQAQVESLLKAKLEVELAAVKAEVKTDIEAKFSNDMDTKLNLMGGDIQGKIDKLNAKFDTQIETHTQNTGMFSGGGIYVMGVAIALIAAVFGTFMWLVKKAAQWKKVWFVLSEVIENHANNGGQAESVKRDFAAAIKAAGLHGIVNKNLETRGFKKKNKS